MGRSATLVMLAGTLAATLSACSSAAYDKQDFIARADAICESAFRQTSALEPPAASGGGSAGLARYIARVAPIVDAEVARVLAVRRPPEDRALLGRYLAALRSSAADYRELAAAARSGDQGALARAEAALSTSPTAALAARYGLESCAGAATVGSGS